MLKLEENHTHTHTPRKLNRALSVEGEYEKQIKLKYYVTNSENAKEKQTG